MNQVLLKTLFVSESTANVIKVKTMYNIVCNKIGIKLKQCEFHLHALSSIGILDDDRHQDRMDYNEFVECWLRILYYQRNELYPHINFDILMKWYKVRQLYIDSYFRRWEIDDMTLPQLIMLFSHLLLLAIPNTKKDSDQILESFQKHKTIRNYNDQFIDEVESEEDDDEELIEDDTLSTSNNGLIRKIQKRASQKYQLGSDLEEDERRPGNKKAISRRNSIAMNISRRNSVEVEVDSIPGNRDTNNISLDMSLDKHKSIASLLVEDKTDKTRDTLLYFDADEVQEKMIQRGDKLIIIQEEKKVIT